MIKKERCPKCGGFVYAEHYHDKWVLRCCQCDLHTDTADSYDTARKLWDKLVKSQERSGEE